MESKLYQALDKSPSESALLDLLPYTNGRRAVRRSRVDGTLGSTWELWAPTGIGIC